MVWVFKISSENMTNSLKVYTYNVRGLRDYTKRREIWHYLHTKKVDICFLQETHSTKGCEKQWSTEWGNKIWFSHGASNARGVAILFSKRVKVKLCNAEYSKMGRFILLHVEVSGRKMLLVNIYAPNVDSPGFFQEIFGSIERYHVDTYLIAGDLNLAIDPYRDRKGSCNNNDNAAMWLKAHMENQDIYDVWRFYNSEVEGYTWYRRKPKLVLSRLDYIFLNFASMQFVKKISIIPGFKTDHSIVQLELCLNQLSKGPGYWKFNVSLLRDRDYLDQINKLLDTKLVPYGG